ncbi:hypothetical protein [Konateibacter massiliensis]|uniref:hypothetical protein n=1 Tax=Konateibacter massiliensis TaxID=2002841 RepID=UPI001179FB64|nr:hypothetical protein [Konateibacter massiliensis]
MKDKKTFLIGALSGALVLAAVEGLVVGGMAVYNYYSEEAFEASFEESVEDELVEESAGVFADNGNAIIKSTDDAIQIEVIPPSGFVMQADYESAYGAGYVNADESVRVEYYIENYTLDEMNSFYEFEKGIFASDPDTYTNVSDEAVQTMEVNGYQVNYVSLSYTYDGTENYTEYCAFVMIDEVTEYMCNIYTTTGAAGEELIKECFHSQIPVAQ